jgi:hypothetical protein
MHKAEMQNDRCDTQHSKYSSVHFVALVSLSILLQLESILSIYNPHYIQGVTGGREKTSGGCSLC